MMKKTGLIFAIFYFLFCGELFSLSHLIQNGMGGGFTAAPEPENSIFYNPAGLAEKSFSYSWQNFDFSGFNYNQFNTHIVTFQNLGYASGGKSFSGNNFSNFNILGFGRSDLGGLKWGVSYRHLEEKINNEEQLKIGEAFDIGFLAHLTPQINLGFSTENLISSNSYFSPLYRLGLAFFPVSENSELIVALDFSHQKSADKSWSYQLGGQMPLDKSLKLKAALLDGKFTWGIKGDLSFVTLNYAQEFSPSGTIQKFGFSFSFFDVLKKRKQTLFFQEKDILVLEIGGSVVGGSSEWSFLGGWKSGADEILGILRDAEEDPYLDGIILKISDFSSGLGGEALIQEFRREIQRIREKGKIVVAYLEGTASGREYYLASSANKIVAPSLAIAGGLGGSLTFFKIYELGQKFGINWQTLSAGKYKADLSIFSGKMSDETKTRLTNLVRDIQNQQILEIAESRNLELKQLETLKDGQLISVDEAKELGLIDKIGYFEDAKKLMGELLGFKKKAEFNLINPDQLIRKKTPLLILPVANKIAVIGINGEIVQGRNYQNLIFGGNFTGADSVCEQIEKAIEENSVKAILLRVNSGGGSNLASAQIWNALKKARNSGKIIVASLGDVAVSGGYYVASASNKIIAEPSTITGYIGVISTFADLEKLFEKFGVLTETVKSSKYADMFSGTRPLTEEEKKMLQGFLDSAYKDFIKAVANGREMPEDKVALLADGLIYTGSQAKKVGLVDELGNFFDAVSMTKELAKITGEPYLVYYNPEYKLFLPFNLAEASKPNVLNKFFNYF